MKRYIKMVLTILICISGTLVYPITIIKADEDETNVVTEVEQQQESNDDVEPQQQETNNKINNESLNSEQPKEETPLTNETDNNIQSPSLTTANDNNNSGDSDNTPSINQISNSLDSINQANENDTPLLTSTNNGSLSATIDEDNYWRNMLDKTQSNIEIQYGITSIPDYAFQNCDNLESITIPSSVVSIGDYAFNYCYSLTSITIPSLVTSIGNSAFYGCLSLTSITIPSSVTSIGDSAFTYCPKLSSITVDFNNATYDSRNNCNAIIEKSTNKLIRGCNNTTIPNTVTSLGDSAFNGCDSLTTITIPSSVTSIGREAFYGCTSLTSITIPSSVTSIGKNVFSNCSNLSSITVDSNNLVYDSRNSCNAIIEKSSNTLIQGCKDTIIPDSVTSIGEWAFHCCNSLESITIPETVTGIGESAFLGCYSLKSITIPSSVTSIGDYAFNYCYELSSITVDSNNKVFDSRGNSNAIIKTSTNTLIRGCNETEIPNGVTTIASDAFNGSNITSITIPSSVTTINSAAFINCNQLKNVYYLGSQEQWNNILISGVNEDLTNANIIYADDYWNNLNKTEDNIKILEGITTIPNNTFENCSSLKSIIIPKTVTSIGDSAFLNCSNLTNVYYTGSKEDWKKISIGTNNECLTNATIQYEEDYWNNLNKNQSNIQIPYGITSIPYYAFQECDSLKTITIPETVTSIGNGAFYYCTILESITIPSSVKTIGDCAFNFCYKLSSITVDSNNTVYDSRNNCNAIIEKSTNTLIQGCNSTTIPDTVTSIGEDAFGGCDSLTTLTIPSSVTSIGGWTFTSCNSLTSITIPSSVTSIGECIFAYCYELSSIVVNANNTVYDSRDNCNAIIEKSSNTLIQGCKDTIIPDSVTSIGEKAFHGCISLESITIPSSVTSIGDYAFNFCDNLSSITVDSKNAVYDSRGNCNAIIETFTNKLVVGCNETEIPNGVTTIASDAFNGSNITSITIPSSVATINSAAFINCIELQNVYYTGTQKQWNSISIADGNENLTNAKILYLEDYWNNLNKTEENIKILEGITTIPNNTFENCSSLKSIIIPKTVVSIGDSAFLNCSNLTNVYYTGSKEDWKKITIGSNNDCLTNATIQYEEDYWNNLNKNQSNIQIPYGITSIPSYAFQGLESLETISIPNTVNNISNSAFEGCTSLKSITIPSSVTSVGEYAFGWCTSLETIVIPESVTSIGYWAFAGCSKLSTIIVDSKNTVYDSRNNCNAIIEISTNKLIQGCNKTVIPDDVVSIEDGAFFGCISLESINIPNSVTSIGVNAFSGCESLKSIAIPNSVILINNSAFTNCSNLTSIKVDENNKVYDSRNDCNAIIETSTNKLIQGCNNTAIPNTVTSIGDYAFEGCQNLDSITIPSSVTSIGYNAFGSCTSLKSITIPLSVTSIDRELFISCSSLSSIIVDSDNPIYDSRDNCNAIIEKSTNTLIQGCNNTTIPDTVTSIGERAFYFRQSLESINIPDSVVSIGNEAFDGCTSLKSINIPESVTSIGYLAFCECFDLSSIFIPSSVTSIDSDAFLCCDNLTIYTDAPSKLDGWSDTFNQTGNKEIPVIYNYSYQDYLKQTSNSNIGSLVSNETNTETVEKTKESKIYKKTNSTKNEESIDAQEETTIIPNSNNETQKTEESVIEVENVKNVDNNIYIWLIPTSILLSTGIVFFIRKKIHN